MIFDMTKRKGGASGAYSLAPYNLLDGVSLSDGYIANGGGVSSASASYQEKVTPYILIPQDNDGKIWWNSAFGKNATATSSWWGVGFYNASQGFISRPSVSSTSGSLAIPNGAVYMRVSFRSGGDLAYAVFKSELEFNYATLYSLMKNASSSYID